MKRITMLLFILIVGGMVSCSNSSEKIYRTTIGLPNIKIHADPQNPTSRSFIMDIPFKSKVEIIDNKSINNRVKIKYKDTIGYVSKYYLSEKDDIPFVDDIKYNLSIHEFDYDKMSAIKAMKEYMLNDKFYQDKKPYYYIDNPQMLSLYGKNCDNTDIKIIVLIMNSKIIAYDSRMICFEVKGNKFIFYADLPVMGMDGIVIEENIKYSLRYPPVGC